MSKYDPLEDYFNSIVNGEIALTFIEIETILDSMLPRSASDHRQWWENDLYHTQAKAWRSAGWKVASVDLTNKAVTFMREQITNKDKL